jgi:hypothetical protein
MSLRGATGVTGTLLILAQVEALLVKRHIAAA